MGKYVIGIDNGGTFVKAALYDRDGKQVALVKEPGKILNDKPGLVERDQTSLWEENCACIRGVIRQSGVNPADIGCIGFAGQGKGVYLVGPDGQNIRNAITSSDTRTWQYIQRWQAEGVTDRIFGKTFQILSRGQPVSILAWMKDNEPEVYARIGMVFSMKDFLVFRMTGKAVSDYCNQSGNNFLNLATKAYDPEILHLLGIPEIEDKLPPLYEATDLCGTVTEEAAKQTGCAPGTPVVTGMFDVDAAAVAAGLVDTSQFCIVTGSHGVNIYLADRPVANKSVMLNSFYCIPGFYLIEEGSPNSAGTLEWALDVLYQPERRTAATNGGSLYRQLDEAIGRMEPGDSDVLCLPFLNGARNNVFYRGTWLGMSAAHRREHLLRAVYEGVAFAHRQNVDRLLANRDRPKAIRLAGGAANSEVWVQIFADVLGFPIEIVDGKELGACGAAMAAGIAAGFHRDFNDAVAKTTTVLKTVLPRADRERVYQTKYDRFLASIRQLEAI